MPMSSNDPRELRAEGVAALQAGDAASARRHFEAMTAAGQADAAIFAALAMACQQLGDLPSMKSAVDRALDLEQVNLPALILKGDYLVAAGDNRGANYFYGAASTIAARAANLPPALAQMVSRAEAARDRINADIERHLHGYLAARGYDAERSSKRFTHSLELLTGRRQRYSQQPRAFYFPDLPDTQFYPRERFPWLAAVEAASGDIRSELAAIMPLQTAFSPYITSVHKGSANRALPELENRDWTAHFLWKDGAPVPENAARCPKTLAALSAVPLTRVPGRAPSILFSRLEPGAHIAPHTGFLNCRLLCHLPLVVPAGCRLRVGNEMREWREGEAWIFNDTIEHEAWNMSREIRVVLIFDIWHPDLAEEECGLVSELMQSVDAYGDRAPPRWDA